MRAMTEVGAGSPYLTGLLAKARQTAASHESLLARQRALRRINRLEATIEGIRGGKLRVGSRKPVADLPIWATPEVIRGGFATGRAAADVDLSPDELGAIEQQSLPRDRGSLFQFLLTNEGQLLLHSMLDLRSYRVDQPEQAALLVLAWLVAHGRTDTAVDLLEAIAPFGSRLRFLPSASSAVGLLRSNEFSRWSVADTAERVGNTQPKRQVEVMREALHVWNPMLDAFVELWSQRLSNGHVTSSTDAWLKEAHGLLAVYEEAVSTHTKCTKHRRPKENLAILRAATRTEVSGGLLTQRELGRVRTSFAAVVAKRGQPGRESHSTIRAAQRRHAALPGHAEFAPIVIERLNRLPSSIGVTSAQAVEVSRPVEISETRGRVAEGMEFPQQLRRLIHDARRGTLNELLGLGVVPSAEVLATFGPRIVSATLVRSYKNPDLGAVMGANYEAFRHRRSLLLLNLEKQVQLSELPWVTAVETDRVASQNASRDALRALSAMTLRHFPGTVVPNPAVREMTLLAREAGIAIPFVEELAADIFMGTFSSKYLAAAKFAGVHLRGSLYERYFDIDYSMVDGLSAERQGKTGPTISPGFDALVSKRTEMNDRGDSWIVRNGATIEQAQVLTTHNVVQLLYGLGLLTTEEYPDLTDLNDGVRRSLTMTDLTLMTDDSYRTAVWKLRTALTSSRPLGFVKDAAYAWRQMILYLTTFDQPAQERWVRTKQAEVERTFVGEPVVPVARSMVSGLAACLGGGQFDPTGRLGEGRRLLGWSGAHWVLEGRRSK
jgi:hypothetical protein